MLVSTPLQVSPIFPIIPSVFIPVFCLSDASSYCFVKPYSGFPSAPVSRFCSCFLVFPVLTFLPDLTPACIDLLFARPCCDKHCYFDSLHLGLTLNVIYNGVRSSLVALFLWQQVSLSLSLSLSVRFLVDVVRKHTHRERERETCCHKKRATSEERTPL